MALPSPIPLLRSKYASNEYCFLEEVRDAAGFNASRSADAVAMNFWPSRGLPIFGFEIKSIRSDWIKEMKSPEKAENIYKYCDYWWLVCAAPGIANIGEIPASWGFMEVSETGKRLKVIKEAPKLTPISPSKDFMATMLKRATQGLIHPSTVQDRIDAARESGKQAAKNDFDYEFRRNKEELTNLKSTIHIFETESGIKIEDNWRYKPGNIGKAVKFILDGGIGKMKEEFAFLKRHSETMQKTIMENMPIFEPEKEIIEP